MVMVALVSGVPNEKECQICGVGGGELVIRQTHPKPTKTVMVCKECVGELVVDAVKNRQANLSYDLGWSEKLQTA